MSEALFKKYFQELEKIQSRSFEKKSIIRRRLPLQKVLVISPHPDDEILQSSLALRLQQENAMQIINVAVTLGSDKTQKIRRKKRAHESCKFFKI